MKLIYEFSEEEKSLIKKLVHEHCPKDTSIFPDGIKSDSFGCMSYHFEFHQYIGGPGTIGKNGESIANAYLIIGDKKFEINKKQIEESVNSW